MMRRVGRALLAVVHDREVQRAGRSLALLALVRLLLALGASVEVVRVVESLLS